MLKGRCQRLTGDRVPHPGHTIQCCRGNRASVRAKSYTAHLISVAHRRADRITGLDIPDDRREILPARDDPASITTKGRAKNAVSMNQWMSDGLACESVPDAGFTLAQLVILTRGDNGVTIKAEFCDTDRQGMAQWRADLMPGRSIPQRHQIAAKDCEAASVRAGDCTKDGLLVQYDGSDRFAVFSTPESDTLFGDHD